MDSVQRETDLRGGDMIAESTDDSSLKTTFSNALQKG